MVSDRVGIVDLAPENWGHTQATDWPTRPRISPDTTTRLRLWIPANQTLRINQPTNELTSGRTDLGREEADEIVEEVDAEAVGDDEPAVEPEDAEGVDRHEPREDEPAEAPVHRRPVQDVLPFPADRDRGLAVWGRGLRWQPAAVHTYTTTRG